MSLKKTAFFIYLCYNNIDGGGFYYRMGGG